MIQWIGEEKKRDSEKWLNLRILSKSVQKRNRIFFGMLVAVLSNGGDGIRMDAENKVKPCRRIDPYVRQAFVRIPEPPGKNHGKDGEV